MDDISGIAGVKGRSPVAVAVSVGVKQRERGFPVEKDRFHLVLPRDIDGTRPHHPAYERFHALPPERRRLLRGTLVHPTPGESFEHHLAAQVLGGEHPSHPNRRPACIGDGIRAQRWDGAEYREIPCPHDRCQFRQPQGAKPAPCKPWMRIVFQIRWPEGNPLPSMLAKYSSGGWNTTANFVGFFEYLTHAFSGASGGRPVSLVGFPFLLTLQEQTNREAKTRFPVVRITAEMDPADFVRRQRDVAELLPPGHHPRIQDLRDDLAEDLAHVRAARPMRFPATEETT